MHAHASKHERIWSNPYENQKKTQVMIAQPVEGTDNNAGRQEFFARV